METKDEKELVLIGFRIPRSLKRRIKIEAAATGKSVQEIMDKIIQDYMEKTKGSSPYNLPED